VRVLSDEVLGQDGVADLDRTRVHGVGRRSGRHGYELETALRDDYGIAVEAADPLNVLLNVTYGDSHDDVALFAAAMTDLAARRRGARPLHGAALPANWPRFTRQVMTPRDAFFARSEAVPVEHTAGRVSAEMVAPYPPGISHRSPRRGDLRRDRRLPERGRGPRHARSRPRGPHLKDAALVS